MAVVGWWWQLVGHLTNPAATHLRNGDRPSVENCLADFWWNTDELFVVLSTGSCSDAMWRRPMLTLSRYPQPSTSKSRHSRYHGTYLIWWHYGIMVSWYHAGIMVTLSSPSLCLWLPRSGGRRVSWNGNQSLIFFLLSQRAKDFKAFSLRNSEAWWTFSVFFCVLETFNTLSFSAPSKTGTQLNGMYIWEPMKMCLRLRRQL